MLELDDERWQRMVGGYRVPIDPRPAFAKLRTDLADADAWKWLWNELHHQGDVGEASYAAVPILVSIYLEAERSDWNVPALVATVELARDSEGNPPVPAWLEGVYADALRQLALRCLSDLQSVQQLESMRAMLAIVAIWQGARTYGRLLLDFTEDEVRELEEQAFGSAE
jgi:hypothetical protein